MEEHLIKSGPRHLKVSESALHYSNRDVVKAEAISRLARGTHSDCSSCRMAELKTDASVVDMSMIFSVRCIAKKCEAAGFDYMGRPLTVMKLLKPEDVIGAFKPEEIQKMLTPPGRPKNDVPIVEGAGAW